MRSLLPDPFSFTASFLPTQGQGSRRATAAAATPPRRNMSGWLHEAEDRVRWVPAGADACTKQKIVPRLPDHGSGLSPSPRRSSATAAAAAHRRNRSSYAGRPTTCSWSCLLRAHARGYLLLGSRRSGCLHDAEDRARRTAGPPDAPDGFPQERSRPFPLDFHRSGCLHDAEDRMEGSSACSHRRSFH